MREKTYHLGFKKRQMLIYVSKISIKHNELKK
jgi:hypothetical protein